MCEKNPPLREPDDNELSALLGPLEPAEVSGNVLTEDEHAIVDLGEMTLTEFPLYENLLDVLVNVPSRNE